MPIHDFFVPYSVSKERIFVWEELDVVYLDHMTAFIDICGHTDVEMDYEHVLLLPLRSTNLRKMEHGQCCAPYLRGNEHMANRAYFCPSGHVLVTTIFVFLRRNRQHPTGSSCNLEYWSLPGLRTIQCTPKPPLLLFDTTYGHRRWNLILVCSHGVGVRPAVSMYLVSRGGPWSAWFPGPGKNHKITLGIIL